MRRINVNPERVWSYYPFAGAGRDLLKFIEKKGWSNVKRVPVFEIPAEIRGGHDFVLADGSHRHEIALHLKCLFPVILYEPDEKIDVERDEIAPFRHSTDPRLYEKLINFYIRRNELARST